jgi:hypothetical protein
VEPAPTLRFVQVARRLGAAARAQGLTVPAFRSPPRVDGVVRTVRRYPGGAVVAVRMRGRAFRDVAGDMVEGVIVVNGLGGEAADRMRRVLDEATGLAHEPEQAAAA